jgi:chromosome segregation ATPase
MDHNEEPKSSENLLRRLEDRITPNPKFYLNDFASHSSKPSESFKPIDSNLNNIKEKVKFRSILNSRAEVLNNLEMKSPSLRRNPEIVVQNSSKVPFLPLLSIRTNALEELYKEIKELKTSINECEERNKVNFQSIEVNKLRTNHLEDRLKRLEAKSGLFTETRKKQELKNKLKTLKNEWKNNSNSLKQTIFLLEEEAARLNRQAGSLKDFLFTNKRKYRKIIKKLNESGSTGDSGHHSCECLTCSKNLKKADSSPSLNLFFH